MVGSCRTLMSSVISRDPFLLPAARFGLNMFVAFCISNLGNVRPLPGDIRSSSEVSACFGRSAKKRKCFGYVWSAKASSSRKISSALGSFLRTSIISGTFLTVSFRILSSFVGSVLFVNMSSLLGTSGKSLIVVKWRTVLPRAKLWFRNPNFWFLLVAVV